MCLLVQPVNIVIVATTGYSKESTHYRYRITISIHVNNLVFYSRPHFLPVNRRKSRNNLFSRFSRSISYACSVIMSLGSASLPGRPLARGKIPAFAFSSLRRSRARSCFTTYLSLNPKCSAISLFVFPAASIARISGSKACTCVYFCLDIILPPDVVTFSFLHQGVFCLLSVFTGPVHNACRGFLMCCPWSSTRHRTPGSSGRSGRDTFWGSRKEPSHGRQTHRLWARSSWA